MATKSTTLTVQKWGNSLAVRIPAILAKGAHVHSGSQVEISLQEGTLVVKPTGVAKLSLDKRLASFDPERHSAEVMATKRIGLEKF